MSKLIWDSISIGNPPLGLPMEKVAVYGRIISFPYSSPNVAVRLSVNSKSKIPLFIK